MELSIGATRRYCFSETMAQRDYLLRMIEQAIEAILRITRQRELGQSDQAIFSVIASMEKLFGLRVADLGGLTVDQLYAQLTTEEHTEMARDKCLVFAALNYQAGLAYTEKDLPALAQPAFHLALVFTLRALAEFPRAGLPALTPKVDDLLFRLQGFELPPASVELLNAYRALP